ncbi:MAG: DnaD domain protein, partial [Oscillospiraceae bacterium]|nr:DnaD domain protein [Oscillospiraceae bacterium]
MDERRYRLPDQETYSISGHALGKLLRRADPNAALTYLYILREGGNLSISCATEALRLAEQEVYDALAVLAKLGLLSGSDTRSPDDPPVGAPPVAPAPPDYEELPQYTAAEIQREMTTDTAFSALVKEVGGALGKILTGDDLRILMGLYRSLGLPPEVIYQLVCHLTKESDSGSRSTMRGIEKMAYISARNGITTLDAALEHIERR